MLLEEVESFQEPDVILEQYSTPATVASDMLHFAYMKGDIEDKKIYDLGCGTGILSIGCKLLGAAEVTGFDSDERALNIARANAKKMDVDIDFIYSDIEEVSGHAQTIVMNPPFGAQKKGSDRPFIKKALSTGEIIYSIHNRGSYDFISKYIAPAIISDQYTAFFPIKRTFKFHKRDVERIEVEIYRIINEL